MGWVVDFNIQKIKDLKFNIIFKLHHQIEIATIFVNPAREHRRKWARRRPRGLSNEERVMKGFMGRDEEGKLKRKRQKDGVQGKGDRE